MTGFTRLRWRIGCNCNAVFYRQPTTQSVYGSRLDPELKKAIMDAVPQEAIPEGLVIGGSLTMG